MPKCPECGENIDHLINWGKVWMKFMFKVDGDGDVDYKDLNDDVATEDNEYDCPECQETLFYDEQQAIEFLSKP